MFPMGRSSWGCGGSWLMPVPAKEGKEDDDGDDGGGDGGGKDGDEDGDDVFASVDDNTIIRNIGKLSHGINTYTSKYD